jgi:hypothetical protein
MTYKNGVRRSDIDFWSRGVSHPDIYSLSACMSQIKRWTHANPDVLKMYGTTIPLPMARPIRLLLWSVLARQSLYCIIDGIYDSAHRYQSTEDDIRGVLYSHLVR